MQNKITEFKKWVGNNLLWGLGFIMLLSINYSIILKGFLLTEKSVNFSESEYIIVSSFGLMFIVGGVYLNRFLDKFTGAKNIELQENGE